MTSLTSPPRNFAIKTLGKINNMDLESTNKNSGSHQRSHFKSTSNNTSHMSPVTSEHDSDCENDREITEVITKRCLNCKKILTDRRRKFCNEVCNKRYKSMVNETLKGNGHAGDKRKASADNIDSKHQTPGSDKEETQPSEKTASSSVAASSSDEENKLIVAPLPQPDPEADHGATDLTEAIASAASNKRRKIAPSGFSQIIETTNRLAKLRTICEKLGKDKMVAKIGVHPKLFSEFIMQIDEAIATVE